MKVSVHTLRFWVVTVAAVAVAAATFSLGQWQLRRAAQKEALQSAIVSRTHEAVLDNQSLARFANPADAVHRQAELKGRWQPQHTVFLDNRPMAGKSGFVVVTPLLLEGSPQAILVERGWVQRDFMDRSRLPAIATPEGIVSVAGRIAPPPSKLYDFKGIDTGRIRQNIDMAGFANEIRLPLTSVSLLQTGAASEGLLREWAAPNLGVEKHYGYAFQWFGLFALTLFLYFGFQWVKPMRARQRELPETFSQNESTQSESK